MTIYVDTSVLVAALTREAETERMQAWLAARRADPLAVSAWTIAEFSAALSIRVRRRDLGPADRAEILAVFSVLCAESFQHLAVTTSDFRAAARFADQYALGLRAGDALHLAIASERGAELATLDQTLAAAGPPLGVKTRLL